MQTANRENSQDFASYELDPESSRRIHQRVQANLNGRFMQPSREEHPCSVIDISVGGVALASDIPVTLGEKIICYLDEIGRVEGAVIRNITDGFAIQFTMNGRQLDKLADHLTWLVNRQYLDVADQRSELRKVPEKSLSVMTLADGTQKIVSLLDVSLGGASVKSADRPPVNDNIHLGDLRAKVLRHHNEGFSVSFLDIQHPTRRLS